MLVIFWKLQHISLILITVYSTLNIQKATFWLLIIVPSSAGEMPKENNNPRTQKGFSVGEMRRNIKGSKATNVNDQ